MAKFSDARQLQGAFHHSLSKTAYESTQNVFESKYASKHTVIGADVYTDIFTYCSDETAADDFVSANPGVISKYTDETLTAIPGSNNQGYYLDIGGEWKKPFVAPTDITEQGTNAPSNGFQTRIYREDGSEIPPTTGKWNIDYYAGMILFDVGSTPLDEGWGDIKIKCYVYEGNTLADGGLGGGDTFLNVNADYNNYTHTAIGDDTLYFVGDGINVIGEVVDGKKIIRFTLDSYLIKQCFLIDDSNVNNTEFSVTDPNISGRITKVFLNGLEQSQGVFYKIINDNTIQIASGEIQVGDTLCIEYPSSNSTNCGIGTWIIGDTFEVGGDCNTTNSTGCGIGTWIIGDTFEVGGDCNTNTGIGYYVIGDDFTVG